MKEAVKWDYVARKNKPYKVPDDAIVFSNDMEEECSCAHCGQKMKFGDGFTSLEITTPMMGIGFCVCSDCYNEEFGRRYKEKEGENGTDD